MQMLRVYLKQFNNYFWYGFPMFHSFHISNSAEWSYYIYLNIHTKNIINTSFINMQIKLESEKLQIYRHII